MVQSSLQRTMPKPRSVVIADTLLQANHRIPPLSSSCQTRRLPTRQHSLTDKNRSKQHTTQEHVSRAQLRGPTDLTLPSYQATSPSAPQYLLYSRPRWDRPAATDERIQRPACSASHSAYRNPTLQDSFPVLVVSSLRQSRSTIQSGNCRRLTASARPTLDLVVIAARSCVWTDLSNQDM